MVRAVLRREGIATKVSYLALFWFVIGINIRSRAADVSKKTGANALRLIRPTLILTWSQACAPIHFSPKRVQRWIESEANRLWPPVIG